MCGRSTIILFYFVIFITGTYILIVRNYITRKTNVENQLSNAETFEDNEGFNVCKEFGYKEVEWKHINISRYSDRKFILFTPTLFIS